jgi:hypothetical protein
MASDVGVVVVLEMVVVSGGVAGALPFVQEVEWEVRLGVGVMESVDKWILARVWDILYQMSIVVGSILVFNVRILICMVLGIHTWRVTMSASSFHLEASAPVLNRWQKASKGLSLSNLIFWRLAWASSC